MAGQVPTQKDAVKIITGHLIQVLEELDNGTPDYDELESDTVATGLGLALKGPSKLSTAEIARLEKAKEIVTDRLGKIGGA